LLAMALVYLVLWVNDVRNLWLLAGTAIVTLTLLLTFTRSAWVGWVVAAAILLVSKRPRMLIFAAPAVVLFVTFMPLPLFGRFVRECARGWNGPMSRFAEIGVAVAFGLAAAGMFEFNFGDTEVFWILLDVCALVVAFIEQARPPNERPLIDVPVNGP